MHIVQPKTYRRWVRQREAKYTNKQYWKQADEITDESLNWLSRNHESPFFVWIHYFEPHLPYKIVPDAFRNRFKSIESTSSILTNKNLSVKQKGIVKTRIDEYDGAIAYADHQFGRLISWLAEVELMDETVVIVSADHGEGLGEHHIHGPDGIRFYTRGKVVTTRWPEPAHRASFDMPTAT